MGIAVVTPPAEEPVSLAELKSHLRVDSTDDNDYITALGKAGREWVESYCNRQLVTATYDYRIDRLPRRSLYLYRLSKALRALNTSIPMGYLKP